MIVHEELINDALVEKMQYLKTVIIKSMTTNLEFSVDKNGVANIVFDLPGEKVNKLSGVVLRELEKAINFIDGNKGIRILLISSAKKDIFIAGADITEIKSIDGYADAKEKVSLGQEIITKIARLKTPTVAVINGACLGGGLELALACQYRVGVINPKTVLGLPEVNLGIIPGFGGTQRLPQLVGLEQSLKMILSGKPVDGVKAHKIGLVDDIVREEFLEEKMGHFVTEIIKNQNKNCYLKKRSESAKKRYIIENIFFKKYLIYYFVKKNLLEKTKGFYPAPLSALEVIKRTYGLTYEKRGFKVELDAFCHLAIGSISKNLIDIYFINESLKKDDGVKGGDKIVGNRFFIRNVSLIGAGVMGGGIAWLFANKDINIRIKDISQEAISLGYKQIRKIFSQLKRIRKYTQSQIDMKMSKVSSGLGYEGFGRCDLVVEAAVENIDIKKSIFKELESKVRPETIIASNTSSLSITKMAEGLNNPERFVGLHFFNPVNRMPLVEVIKGEKTSDETVIKTVKIAKKLGKTPIVVKDVAGFCVNRILLPLMNEAAYLLQDGGDIETIDHVIESFGMPMGPFVLADVVGIDIGYKVASSLQESYGSRMQVAKLLEEIYASHPDLLGKKSGIGFYNYVLGNKKPIVNPEIKKIMDDLRKSHDIPLYYANEEKIIDRCILTMVNEAAKCIEEGVVANPQYLDMAMVMGAGFPAFRGGILKYADSRGIHEVTERLKRLEDKVGERFTVSQLLKDMDKAGERFYT